MDLKNNLNQKKVLKICVISAISGNKKIEKTLSERIVRFNRNLKIRRAFPIRP